MATPKKWRSDTALLRQKSKLFTIMRENAGKNSSHEIEERIQSKDGCGDQFLQDRRDDRPLIYQHAASDYSRGSLRQVKLKLRVEGLIGELSIKEIMERKTTKDTKMDGSEMAGPHIAAGKAVSRGYAAINLPHSSRC